MPKGDIDMEQQINERRQRQRVAVGQAGSAGFRLVCDGQPMTVRDVSLDGFAMLAATAPDASHEFGFRLEHDGRTGAITGRAQVVNYVRGALGDSGVAGCRILHLDGDGAQTLRAWLSEHVARVAGVPVSREEALDIVEGPSLV